MTNKIYITTALINDCSIVVDVTGTTCRSFISVSFKQKRLCYDTKFAMQMHKAQGELLKPVADWRGAV